jgi:hypothetical protein
MIFGKKKSAKKETLASLSPVFGQLAVLIEKNNKFSYGFVKAIYDDYIVFGVSEGYDSILPLNDNCEDSLLLITRNGQAVMASDEVVNAYETLKNLKFEKEKRLIEETEK